MTSIRKSKELLLQVKSKHLQTVFLQRFDFLVGYYSFRQTDSFFYMDACKNPFSPLVDELLRVRSHTRSCDNADMGKLIKVEYWAVKSMARFNHCIKLIKHSITVTAKVGALMFDPRGASLRPVPGINKLHPFGF